MAQRLKDIKNKGHQIKKRVKSITKKTAAFIKFNRDMVNSFFDNYILNDLITEDIQNDLGASFTTFKREGGKIIKLAKTRGEQKLINEINWYLLFGDKEFSRYLPEIIDYSTEKGDVYLEMKYYKYPNMRKMILDDMNSLSFIKKRWKHMFNVLHSSLYVEGFSRPTPDNFVEKSHFSKLQSRVRETIRMAPFLKEVIKSNELIINNKSI